MFDTVYTNLIIPFKNGAPDIEHLGRLVDWQMDNGIYGFVLFQDSGESHLIPEADRETIIAAVKAKTKGLAQLAVDCTAISPTTVRARMESAASRGANFVSVAPPPYLQLSQSGLFQFYKDLAQSTPIPTVIVNDPKRCGTAISTATAIRLCEFHSLACYLETDTNPNRIQTIQRDAGNKMAFMGGSDHLAVPMLLAGAAGICATSAMVAPAKWSAIWQHRKDKDIGAAGELAASLGGLVDALEDGDTAATVKAALMLQGLCEPEVIEPISWPTRAQLYRIGAEMDKLQLPIKSGEL